MRRLQRFVTIEQEAALLLVKVSAYESLSAGETAALAPFLVVVLPQFLEPSSS